MLKAVIDTNVLFEGLTTMGSCGEVVDAWVAKQFVPCVSTALALEYEEVLTNKLGTQKSRRTLAALQALLNRATFVPIFYTVRPASPDADDDFVIDCAFNAGACIVTRNTRDFRGLKGAFGIEVFTPEAFLVRVRRS